MPAAPSGRTDRPKKRPESGAKPPPLELDLGWGVAPPADLLKPGLDAPLAALVVVVVVSAAPANVIPLAALVVVVVSAAPTNVM